MRFSSMRFSTVLLMNNHFFMVGCGRFPELQTQEGPASFFPNHLRFPRLCLTFDRSPSNELAVGTAEFHFEFAGPYLNNGSFTLLFD